MKFMQIRHLILALALAAAAPFAAAAFQSNMTVAQAEAEVRAQLTANTPLVQIARNALAAGLSAELVTTALLNATDVSTADVVTAMLGAGASLQTVVNAALAAGASANEVTRGALAAGVTLEAVRIAIAASPTTIALAGRTLPNGALGAGSGGGTCGPKSVSPC